MENVTEHEKKTLSHKLLGFQRTGLISYGKYLAEQLEFASKSTSRNAYKKYIENQIVMNDKKIIEIDEKMK